MTDPLEHTFVPCACPVGMLHHAMNCRYHDLTEQSLAKGRADERARIIEWLRRPAQHNEDDTGRRRAAGQLEAMRP